MKKIKYIPLFVLFLAIYNCNPPPTPAPEPDEASGLKEIQKFSNETHDIVLYSESGILLEGYNEISLRILDKATGKYVTNSSIAWKPMMTMTMSTHSCPVSAVKKVPGKNTLYRGMMIFQMPEKAPNYWQLTINYRIGQTDYTVKDDIKVHSSEIKNVNVFLGTDGLKYILAYMGPENLSRGVNEMTVGLFRMNTFTSFSVVNDYEIKISPRLLNVNNNGEQNDTTLRQPISGEFYHGTLFLRTIGDWTINIQVMNTVGKVIKGEEVTSEQPKSSIFFEISL